MTVTFRLGHLAGGAILAVLLPTLAIAQIPLTSQQDAFTNRLIEEYAASAAICMHSAVGRALAGGEREAAVIQGFALQACGRPLAQFALSKGRTVAQVKALLDRMTAGAVEERDPAYGPLCRGRLERGACDGPIN